MSRLVDILEYRILAGMKQRCYDKNCKDFKNYGARGITICDRWLETKTKGFYNFLEDMGKCPEGMSIDRINVDGDYTPDNCRWATYSEQNHNRNKLCNNKSGKTGVFELKSGYGWQAFIMFDKKRIHLGTFKTFEQAKEAREAKELELFGQIKNC